MGQFPELDYRLAYFANASVQDRKAWPLAYFPSFIGVDYLTAIHFDPRKEGKRDIEE